MRLICLIPVEINIDVFDFNMSFADRSGKISQKELERVFKALNMPINANQLKQLVAAMDSDNSGMNCHLQR